MQVQFATCERNRALDYIKQVYPSYNITDTDDCAGPLLDFVGKDIIRIQDPMMYGNKIQVIPSKNYTDDQHASVISACKLLTEDKNGKR